MKKIWALVLAAVLTLALAACGSESGPMTKEEMLEAAAECDVSEILSACGDNKVNAEETYCGKICLFTGYVKSIGEASAEIVPLNSPLTFDGHPQVLLTVALSADEIKALSTNQVVRVVGEIASLGEDGSAISLETAYYLDNLITFSAEVDGFASNAGVKQTTLAGDMEMVGDYPVKFSYTYRGEYVDLSQPGAFDAFKQETFQNVTVVEGDLVTVTGTLTYDRTTYSSLGGGLKTFTMEFSLTGIDSIKKG